MLLPREQSPWNCGYYLGAIALRALNKAPEERADLLALQERMSSSMDPKAPKGAPICWHCRTRQFDNSTPRFSDASHNSRSVAISARRRRAR